MRWFHGKDTATDVHEDDQYVERAEKVTDLTTRLRMQRKRNGFGKMFDEAVHAPRRERNTG